MRPGRIVVFVLVVAATRLIGCGNTISAAHYDQTCKYASDCEAVGVGDPCSTSCMSFPSADAISRNAGASYSYDAVEAQYHCSHCGSTLGNCSASVVSTKSAWCNAGVCTLCDDPDSCKCAPKDPTCGKNGGSPPPTVDGGVEGGSEGGGGDAAPEGGPHDGGTEGGATDSGSDGPHDAGQDGASEDGGDAGDAAAD